MFKYLIKKFVKDYDDVHDIQVRKSYGILSGVVGVICNLVLFFLKFSVGIRMNSIAVISDAFNNLTDSGSSVITIFGANVSSKPPDDEHPYGHGRMEYIAALIVSFIIFTVGFELLQTSIDKIMNPEKVEFNFIAIAILVVSVFIKIWMYFINNYVGEKINSNMNIATAKDSLNDVISSTGVIVGTIIGAYVNFPVDGIIGLLISGLIIYLDFPLQKIRFTFY